MASPSPWSTAPRGFRSRAGRTAPTARASSTASLVLFSATTIACGLAATYPQLLLARIGVALGEGGTNPASHSLIADLYPEGRRATALGVFALGPNLGILLGFGFGGVIGQAWGWRAALVAAGVTGLAVAGLSGWLLREPQRAAASRPVPPPGSAAALFRQPAVPHLFAGAALMSMAAYGSIGWLPAFLVRTHGFGTASAGLALALLFGGVGALGTLLGGVLADRLGARDPAWRVRVVAAALLVAAPFWLLALIVPRPAGALACLVVPAAALCFYLAPTFAAVQSLAMPSARALAAALLLLVGSVVGLGLGPALVGLLSDALRPAYGEDSLRLALLLVVPLVLWSAAHYHAASRRPV